MYNQVLHTLTHGPGTGQGVRVLTGHLQKGLGKARCLVTCAGMRCQQSLKHHALLGTLAPVRQQ